MTESGGVRAPLNGVSVDTTGCDVDDLVFCGAVEVRAGAEEDWDSLVDRAVASGWIGIEALAREGGSVARVTRDNASAYGQAVADSVVSVRTWDRETGAQRTFALVDCGFRQGGSRFQDVSADGSPRFEILEVALLLKQGELAGPITDPALAGILGIEPGQRVTAVEVRDAVRRQRAQSGAHR